MNLTRGVIAIALSTCVALSGCQHTGSVSTEGTTLDVTAADTPVVQPGARAPTFAYAVSKFEPELSLQSGYAHAVGSGAAQGLGTCAGVLAGPPGMPSLVFLIQFGLFAICAPFGAAAGAVSGAGLRADQSDTTQVATSVAKEHKMPAVFAAQLETYARGLGLVSLRELADQGPRSPGDQPRYRSETDYVIEVTLIRIKAEKLGDPRKPHGLEIEARGRLIRTSDGVTLDAFSPMFRSERMTTDQWMANPGRIGETLIKGFTALAKTFVDEFVFIYRKNGPDAEPLAVSAIEPDVLRPLDWPEKSDSILGLRGLPAVVDLDPGDLTLRWEEIPRSLASSLYGPSPAVRNVVYDVRLFRARLSGDPKDYLTGQAYLARGHVSTLMLERSIDGLTEPLLRVDPPLQPCALYTWTVRARFDLYGEARVTDWSWLGGSWGEGDPRPKRRKLVGDPNAAPDFSDPSNFYHYWFVARPAGSTCDLPSGIPRQPQPSRNIWWGHLRGLDSAEQIKTAQKLRDGRRRDIVATMSCA